MWKKLWLLNITPKAKLFLWRANWDIIPHNGNLQKKGVLESSKCPRCGEYESSLHVFRDCSWARKFWSLAPTMICIRQPLILNEAKTSNVELLANLLWQIWLARNELCFEKIYILPMKSVSKGQDMG